MFLLIYAEFEEGWTFLKVFGFSSYTCSIANCDVISLQEKALDPILGHTKGPLTLDYMDNNAFMECYNK